MTESTAAPAAPAASGPRNLNPRLFALGQKLERGALVRLSSPAPAGPAGKGKAGQGAAPTSGNDPASPPQVLTFQYNPETLTRSRQGTWEARKQRRSGVAPQEARTERGGQGSGAVNADAEQISFKLVFDATENVLAGEDPDAAATGVLPELAFLEVAVRGGAAPATDSAPAKGAKGASGSAKGGKAGQGAQPVRPDELLLVLGGRAFPVVLTSLTITEQKFLPTLVPLRAEVDLRLTVLEAGDSAYRQWIGTSFTALLKAREDAAAIATKAGPSGAVTAAIQAALTAPAPSAPGGSK